MLHSLSIQWNKMTVLIGRLSIHLQIPYRMPTIATKKHSSSNAKALDDVTTLCQQGRVKEALQNLHVMDNLVDCGAYVSLLQTCIQKKALAEGKLIHAHINQIGFVGDTLVANTLVNMYAKCRSVADARRVFDQMPQRDVCSWTVMIAAYARHGPAEEALVLFHQMQGTGQHPNHFTYSSILSACANLACLEKGMEIHEELTRRGFQSHLSVANSLVDMYGKCGYIEKAREVFDKMHQRDVVSWTTMVAGYARNGLIDEAQRLFKEMPYRNEFACNAMIIGFADNGFVDEAVELFKEMPQPTLVSWTAIIGGLVRNGHCKEALKIFSQMESAGIMPDLKSFASIVPACSSLAALKEGMEIHAKIIKNGFQGDVIVGNALIDMYAKCGNMYKAHELFKRLRGQDVVSWTALIAGYSRNGLIDEALRLFKEMPQRNMISWTAMIAGFAENGLIDEALDLFRQIPQSIVASCNAIIGAFADNGLLDEALQLFKEMPERTVVSWTAMIVGFAHNGLVNNALELFKEMPERNVISWTAMIAGFAQNGHVEESLKLFQQMQLAGVSPDSKALVSVITVCANLAALEHGMEIHEKVIRSGFQSDVIVVNALIDMYAKCGSILKACELFDKMHLRDVVSWTVMIAGYAIHGYSKEALNIFEQMKYSGVKPDHVTFVCVLSACSHAGLVDEGYQYFNSMCEYYHITPAMDHYMCMVDLLGRAGHLDEAKDFISNMALKANAAVWSCLLAACVIHNNIELGQQVAQCVFDLDPEDDAPYVLLSNLYAAAGRWGDIKKIRQIMTDKTLKKTPGCSWIEVNKQVHAFVADNR